MKIVPVYPLPGGAFWHILANEKNSGGKTKLIRYGS
jgi:hypothetical protein